MATFTYQGTTRSFAGNSGIFICSTTATGGGGTQSNGLLLQYRGSRTIKRYRDASVTVFLGRSSAAVEVGQYDFRGMDLQYAIPPSALDYDGTSTVTGDTIESRLNAIDTALAGGNFVEVQDSRGRHFYGSWTQDPQIEDLPVGWRQVSASMVECA